MAVTAGLQVLVMWSDIDNTNVTGFLDCRDIYSFNIDN